MKSKGPDHLSILFTKIFAVLLLIFGFIGFYNGRSVISLLSGGTVGITLFGFSIGMKKNPRFYTFGAMILLTVLMASFFFRALASHKMLPTVFGFLSLCLFLFLFYRRAGR